MAMQLFFDQYLPAFIVKNDGLQQTNQIQELYNGKELLPAIYGNGIYVILEKPMRDKCDELIWQVFPATRRCASVFARDWMGRVFAIDASIPDQDGNSTVVCFDFAEPSSFATDASYDDFHNITSIQMKNDLFNINQYSSWKAVNSESLINGNIVGYKVPLFLGGIDSIENMELCDFSVYLHITTELWLATL